MLLSNNLTGTSVNSYTGQGVQPVVQAQLATNLTNSTLVLGNTNTVSDTLGTGNWKFYMSPTTSVEAITSASASAEWTGGSLLSYTDIDYYMFYTFNTNAVSGNTLLNLANNAYDATLYGNASIINTVPSPATKPTSTGTGYLEMNVGTGQYVEMNHPISLNASGLTFAFWFRWTSNVVNTPVFSFDDGTYYFIIFMWTPDWCSIAYKTPSGTNTGYFFNRISYGLTVGEWVHIAFKSSGGGMYLNGILIASISNSNNITFFQPTRFYLGNTSASASFLIDGKDFVTKPGTISVDNFIFYNKSLINTEIGALYAQSTIYYTFDSDSISGGTSVGSKATGIYVYNATLVNGASIGTTNPSPAPTSGTGQLSLTSTNTIATNPHVKLTFQPVFTYQQYFFSVAFWARSNSTLGSSAKITFFDFANNIAASENANYSYSMYLQSNNIRAKISYGTIGTATDDIIMYTDSNILTDNVWRHYAWTIDNTTTWRLYINSVLVFTKSSGFNRGTPIDYVSPSTINYGNCFIGRDAGSWQTASFSGAIDEFRWYKSRTISQGEISNLYSSQAYVGQLGEFQNPSGSSPIWMSKPATTILNTFETSYTVKSNEIALIPGANSTYAVWTAAKTTNVRVDVSFADYHSRSTGVGFQIFKINADDTFGSTIFPRTVTSAALTDSSSNYLSVPSITLSVSPGDKIFYRIDANGNTVSASSVLATNIYADSKYIPVPNPTNVNEIKVVQAQLATNLNNTTLVSGNANIVYDTVGTSNWKFYVAGNTSVEAITSSSSSTEWTGGSLLNAQYDFDGILMNGATLVVDAGSRVTGNPYLKFVNPTLNTPPYQYAKFTPISIPSGGISFSMWVKHTSLVSGTYPMYFSIRGNGQNFEMGLYNPTPEWYVTTITGQSIKVTGTVSTITNGNWHHLVWTISASGMFNMYLDNSLKLTQQSTYPDTGLRTYYNLGSYNDSGDYYYLINGAIDNFKIFTRELTASEVTAEYNNTVSTMPFLLKSDSVFASKWTIKPATTVDANDTSYTVKSNEIALKPGTNSTYAIWTAPKTTNIRVDVSFADYHSRSAGVGFQMFKINADNTFASTIFPRTVTSEVLTDSSANYLSVPSTSLSVVTGDKVFYRIDANGNTTAASSVLATNIYSYSGIWN